MKGKRDRSVAALVVVDMCVGVLSALPTPPPLLLPTQALLLKRFAYRFPVVAFSVPAGCGPVVPELEAPLDVTLVREHADVTPIITWLRGQSVSALYVAGATLEGAVLRLAEAAAREGMAVHVVVDATHTGNADLARMAQEALLKLGVSLVTSATL